MSKIDIGIKIDLETFIETKLLIEADSGSGKSWTIRKIAEECSGKVQQIIIDPEGDFITLREKYPFALVSKSGGDIPLNLRYAEALAHKLLETGISVIIDLYEFKQHEREQFVKVFCEALMNAPKSLRHSCLVYLDEAQLFCPEDKRAISTSAVVDLCTRGRKRGLCAILATLRISILNKSAAAQCKNKMMGSTSLPLDQKRVGDELGLRTKEEIRDLRNLGKGEFWAFGPAISKEIVKFKVGQVKTTHIKSGSKLTSAPPTPAAIKKILSKLEDIPEEAEKELATKKEYQAEIKRLNAELKNSKKDDKESDPKLAGKVLQLQNDLKNHKILANALKKELDGRTALLNKIKGMIHDFKEVKVDPEILKPVVVQQPKKGIPVVNMQKPMIIDHKPKQSNGTVSGGEKLTLIACASYPNGLRRDQLIVFTGYKQTSRDIFISRLKNSGYLVQDGERLKATEAGVEVLGDDYEPIPQGEELQQYWLNKLGGGEKVFLELLISAYPNSISRDELGAKANYKPTSRDIFISRLASRELLTIPHRGEVKASDELFN